MAGYYGFSMSNNAVEAYRYGAKPISKWTKKEIIKAIENAVNEDELTLNCNIEKLKRMPLKALRKECLFKSSWHHTSSYYNETDFYSLDSDDIENLTDEKIEEIIKACKEEKEEKQEEPTEERWQCAFLEWSGTRNHPKATEVIEEGIIKGNWFYRADGSKKKTSANGFRFLKQIQ